jgi:hypothetical protein
LKLLEVESLQSLLPTVPSFSVPTRLHGSPFMLPTIPTAWRCWHVGAFHPLLLPMGRAGLPPTCWRAVPCTPHALPAWGRGGTAGMGAMLTLKAPLLLLLPGSLAHLLAGLVCTYTGSLQRVMHAVKGSGWCVGQVAAGGGMPLQESHLSLGQQSLRHLLLQVRAVKWQVTAAAQASRCRSGF